ncbi:nucleoside triphosphate pyrophosphohydrolase [candidate division TA06 bacterium]|uniref:Nucleoside triphosphate pyrophosphohydrolase n=1 Tax=candidate division TA06 bacterium TaxID=2250710 RepID=A0A933MID3_UNCT6|nr:nucleoside triphosphate pyrophosphohydrolase [candidate division TA06 bacterium]
MPIKNKTKTNRKRPNGKLSKGKPFYDLVDIFARLRAPGGCPWDRVQSHKSLKPYLIEEAYEVIEAIDENDPEKMKEELGDLLGQIIFHSQMAAEEQRFDIDQVVLGHAEKMKRRHPHVFGQTHARDAKEVLMNWEEIKYQEKKNVRRSALDGIPRRLPALLKAHRIQDKAARLGFDWERIDGAFAKLEEELGEFSRAYNKGNKKEIQDELGDILFTLVNLSRFLKIDPEDALRQTSEKFTRRFKYIEQQLAKTGKTFKQSSLEGLEALWQQAKKQRRFKGN